MKISIKSLVANSSYLFIAGIGGMALSMFQGIVVARGLGASQLGMWAIVVSSCSLVQALLSFRTQEPLTRYLVEFRQSQEHSKLKLLLGTAILTDLFTNILSWFFVVVLSPILASSLPSNQRIVILALYGASFLFQSFDNTWYCIARDQKQLGKQSIKQFCTTLIQFLGILAIYLSGHLNLYHLAFVIFLSSFLRGIISCFLLSNELFKGYGLKINNLICPNLLSSFQQLDGFWAFMKATFLSNIFSSLIKNSDILVLGYFSSTSEVGFYQVAKSLASICSLVIQSFSSIIYQDLNEIIRSKQILELRSELTRITRICFPTLTVLSIILCFFMYPVINLFYGNEYSYSYSLFMILFTGVFVGMNLFWSQSLILALDLYKYKLRVVIFTGILNFFLMLCITPIIGTKGLAACQSLTTGLIPLFFTFKSLSSINRLSKHDLK